MSEFSLTGDDLPGVDVRPMTLEEEFAAVDDAQRRLAMRPDGTFDLTDPWVAGMLVYQQLANYRSLIDEYGAEAWVTVLAVLATPSVVKDTKALLVAARLASREDVGPGLFAVRAVGYEEHVAYVPLFAGVKVNVVALPGAMIQAEAFITLVFDVEVGYWRTWSVGDRVNPADLPWTAAGGQE